jgi:hypothetical protein
MSDMCPNRKLGEHSYRLRWEPNVPAAREVRISYLLQTSRSCNYGRRQKVDSLLGHLRYSVYFVFHFRPRCCNRHDSFANNNSRNRRRRNVCVDRQLVCRRIFCSSHYGRSARDRRGFRDKPHTASSAPSATSGMLPSRPRFSMACSNTTCLIYRRWRYENSCGMGGRTGLQARRV